ncbi:MAG: thiamine-phosphate kinase [Candidatus Omnitrophota bacterium]|nr:thiamine-phosphate kinase [Candidatus Omnitrophota bacterium]
MRIKEIDEIKLIKRLSKNFRLDETVIKGPGDDAAVLEWTKDRYMLFTCDMTIENVHFDLKKAAPFQIGWKALGRNISDIGAMGGVPKYAVVSLGISPALNISVADGICKGIKSLADKFGVNIVGGDMAKSEKIIIDISLIGQVEKKKLTLRSGARVGDSIFVTGTLGRSIKRKHLNFMPRVNTARQILSSFKIDSMIDISDGLALDLNRVLEASSVGSYIYESALPLSEPANSVNPVRELSGSLTADADFKPPSALRDNRRLKSEAFSNGVNNALYDGEDYELLFTMGTKEARRFIRTTLNKTKTPITLIGGIVSKKEGCKIIRKSGKKESLKVKGYLHF